MSDFRIRILVVGEDQASAPLGRVSGALGNMAQIAGGIISAQALMGVARGIMSIGMNAINATAQIQSMEMGMASLAAREIAAAANAQLYADAAAKGLDRATVSTMKISDALPQAEGKAKELMDELANIAIVSPYQLQTVQGSYQMAAAFGYSSTEAMKFTKALLNVGAGVGADNERLNRMAYNLAQIRMVGKVTALDFRQLSMAGFDLNAVLVSMGDELGVEISNYEDFNKAIDSGKISWEQFSDSFMKYSEDNFGGSAERMARTFNGLKSTLSDVFVLTFPRILGPALQTFTDFGNSILDGFLKIRESPILDQMAQGINDKVAGITASLAPLVDKVVDFIEVLAGVKDAAVDIPEGMGLMQSEGMLVNIGRFVDSVREVVGFVRPFVDQIVGFLSANVKLTDFLVVIGGIILSAVIPALLSAAAAIAPFLALVGLVAVLRNIWESNWLGIRDILIGVWTTEIQPALQALWQWLQVNVPLALQALSAYWQTTLLPAIQAVWGWISAELLPLLAGLYAWLKEFIPLALAWLANFWTTVLYPAISAVGNWIVTVLLPILGQLWGWLKVNIPLALTWLSNLWTTVLLPAILAVGNWITTVLVPILSTLWNWLATNIPLAIQTLSDFWNNVLLPAVTAVWSFISGTLFPFFQSLADFLSAVLGVAVTALAGLWENVLQPALSAVGEYISSKLQPVFDAISTFIGGTLQPVAQTFGDFLGGAFLKAFEGIRDVVQDVTGWLSDMAAKIRGIKLPDWLTPGSPTPFEIGLRGIADALQDVNKLLLPTLSVAAYASSGNPAGYMGGGAVAEGDTYVINNYNEKTAALNMAWISSHRTERLNSRMGR